MKTLANCTPKEFAVQTVKIAEIVRRYADGVRAIRAKLPKLPEGASAEDIRKAGTENFFNILQWCMETNVDGTMELCGAVCFMSGEDFAGQEDPADGEDCIAAVLDVLSSERCLHFFDALLRAQGFIKRL